MYCPKCQALSEDGRICPSCGSGKLREARPEDPILLLTAGGGDCDRITEAFREEEIPCELRMNGIGSPPEKLFGRVPGSEKNIYVPYGALNQCREILESLGMLDDSGRMKRTKDSEMSTPARAFWRIISILLFLLLVWAVVTFADRIAEAVKAWFSIRACGIRISCQKRF